VIANIASAANIIVFLSILLTQAAAWLLPFCREVLLEILYLCQAAVQDLENIPFRNCLCQVVFFRPEGRAPLPIGIIVVLMVVFSKEIGNRTLIVGNVFCTDSQPHIK